MDNMILIMAMLIFICVVFILAGVIWLCYKVSQGFDVNIDATYSTVERDEYYR